MFTLCDGLAEQIQAGCAVDNFCLLGDKAVSGVEESTCVCLRTWKPKVDVCQTVLENVVEVVVLRRSSGPLVLVLKSRFLRVTE